MARAARSGITIAAIGSGHNIGAKTTPYIDMGSADIGSAAPDAKRKSSHGIITWAAEMFAVSRTSIYALGERIEERVLSISEQQTSPLEQPQVEFEKGVEHIKVTPEHLKRTILASTFPGNVSIRPTQDILEAAFEQRSGIGAISELRLEAGRRAGRVLAELDYSSVGAEWDAPSVVIGRDETFFQGAPLLLVIEPVSFTILPALLCTDRRAETWGAVLELVREQGLSIAGLVEDMARSYEKSQKLYWADTLYSNGPSLFRS